MHKIIMSDGPIWSKIRYREIMEHNEAASVT